MQWDFIVAVVVAVPVIIMPVALIWYFVLGGSVAWVNERKLCRQTDENEAA
jgi:hypothetical protein